MKKLYTNRLIHAEQFTDDCTPEGVIKADPEFIEKVLVESTKKEVRKSGAYLYKLPKPDESDYEVAALFKVPYPFAWIHKGDYVVTSLQSGYSRVESKKLFEADYKEIGLL